MQAVILAGGLGTRLGSLTAQIPKAMVPIADRPVLHHLLDGLRRDGARDVTLCVGHLAEAIVESVGDGSAFGLRVSYAHERELLGTGGAVLNARGDLRSEPFLVMNGDTLLPKLDYRDLFTAHAERSERDPKVVGTLVVVTPVDAGAYGVVETDENCLIRGFREKAPVEAGTGLVSGGVYVLAPDVFEFIPPGRAVSIEFEVFPAVLAAGKHLLAYRHREFCGDMGTPEGLERVRQHFAAE